MTPAPDRTEAAEYYFTYINQVTGEGRVCGIDACVQHGYCYASPARDPEGLWQAHYRRGPLSHKCIGAASR